MIINRIGLRTLFMKELRRFMNVWMQTILSPFITSALYFLVFGITLGSRISYIGGVPYIDYVIPGLVMLGIISNAFLNTSSSLFQSKINGTIIDLLVAPLGTLEILLAYVGAAVVRGILVGTSIYLVAIFFVSVHVHHWLWTFYFAVTVATSFAVLGVIAAVWAEKFDQLAILPNFVLTPLIFLGGVFYSVQMLPTFWHAVSLFNPLLYMINGMRYGLLGQSDIPPLTAAAVCLAVLVGSTLICIAMLRRGYKLRG